MGQGILRALRICLLLLAFINAIMAIYSLRSDEYIFSDYPWALWFPLVPAIISDISYTWALRAQKAQRNIIQSDAARYTCSVLLCAAWLVSPSYVVDTIVRNLREIDGSTEYFFQVWSCGDPLCSLGLARDLCGFFMAFFVFLEMILAYRYERSSKAYKHDAGAPTTIIVGPAPVLPAHYAPHQYVYGSAQPGQPVAYHPQPMMAGIYQTPTMPYQQGPTTPYPVQQQTQVYQPNPPQTQ
ncbi:MAG: hypothetical protein J3Q66DRAFT_403394 [Benniella sp.]|nr:MAG: hypothetical protein J3Q66DRAFT_403394 [Benniella sp.]